MVNRRMKPAQVLGQVRKLARQHDLTVEELPGRGEGSHSIYVLVNTDGEEVGRIGLTGHARDLSWKVLRSAEDGLVHLFGENRTEQR